jgi:exosortase/archaeosortase family protein
MHLFAFRHKRVTPLWGFILSYFVWAVLLFFLFYFKEYSPFYLLNTDHTELSIYLTGVWLNIFDIPITLSGESLIFSHGMVLRILDECNGIVPFLFYLAAILAYPAKVIHKLIWALIGYVLLMAANAVRIDWILYHMIEHPEDLVLAHEIVGRYTMALLPLLLFYIFSQRYTLMEHSEH